MDRVTGGCSCGKVRLVATGRPDRIGLCHCLDCRTHHGAPFHASAIFPKDAAAITGQTRACRDRHFCPEVFDRSGDEIEGNLGSLDAPDQFAPGYKLWTIRREGWLPPFPTRAYSRTPKGMGRSEG